MKQSAKQSLKNPSRHMRLWGFFIQSRRKQALISYLKSLRNALHHIHQRVQGLQAEHETKPLHVLQDSETNFQINLLIF